MTKAATLAEDVAMAQVWGLTVTWDVAQTVRRWRVEEDHTWRGVAECADEAWGTDTHGNQIFGEALCRESAWLLGEDPSREPWN